MERLAWDLEALAAFFSTANPPYVKARMSKMSVVAYGCGDASGAGFGSSGLRQGTLRFWHGLWSPRVQQESSNFCELWNVANAIIQCAKDGDLDNTELFFLTENSVTEACAKSFAIIRFPSTMQTFETQGSDGT